MEDKDFYSSGEMAKICGISLRTVRYYDEIGLVVPKIKDEHTNHRFYTRFHIWQFEMIKLLKELNFSLDEIRKLDFKNIDLTFENLKTKKQRNLEEIEKLKKSNLIIDQWIYSLSWYRENVIPDLQETQKIKYIPSRRVAYLRKTSPDTFEYRLKRYREFYKLTNPAKLNLFGPVLYLYHSENKYGQDDVDYEICQQIKRDYCSGDVSIRIIPEGEYAVYIHQGTHEKLGQSYFSLRTWMHLKGYKKAGPDIFQFIFNQGMARKDEELITEIQIKVTKDK